MYNYGSLLMMPSTEEIQRDKKQGIDYLITAAQKGHSKAAYAMGLIYLDGVDLYYSCELGVNLLRLAA